MTSKALTSAVLVAIAGLVANVLNALFTLYIAHPFSTAAYGAFTQVSSIFFLVALPGSALGVAVVRRAAHYVLNHDHETMLAWQRTLYRRVWRVMMPTAGALIAASRFVGEWLGNRSWIAVSAVAIAGVVWGVLSVDRALLQVRQDYRGLAFNIAFEGVARLVLMMALSAHGVTAVLVGLLLAEVATRVQARQRVPRGQGGAMELEHTGITLDLLIALGALGSLSLLQFADIFALGHVHQGPLGGYSAASQIAKTIVYGAVIIGGFLLPEAVLDAGRGKLATRQLFIAFGLVLVAGLVLVTVSATVGPHLINAVFGSRYGSAATALLPLSIAMSALALTTLGNTYLMATGYRWHAVVLIVLSLGSLSILSAAGGNFASTARWDLAVQVVVMLVVLGGVAYEYLRQRE